MRGALLQQQRAQLPLVRLDLRTRGRTCAAHAALQRALSSLGAARDSFLSNTPCCPTGEIV
jgi:hypothetical protein